MSMQKANQLNANAYPHTSKLKEIEAERATGRQDKEKKKEMLLTNEDIMQ